MTVLCHINTLSDIPDAIAKMRLAGADHRVPLLQALYRGEIAFLELHRPGSASLFKRWAAMIRLPGIALIGDDSETKPDSPDAWPMARRALRWARFVLIHGGAGKPEHYEFAVDLARQYRRLLLIECSSENVLAWQQAAERWAIGAEGQVMRPPPGFPHPAPPAEAELH